MPHPIQVSLPEGALLPLRLAGLGARALAALMDAFLQAALLGLGIGILLPLLLGDAAEDPLPYQESLAYLARAGLTFWVFGVVWVYHVAFELLMDGQTPGKRRLGLRVTGRDGLPPGFKAAALRNILRPIDLFPLFYGVGGLLSWLTPEAQRLGDLAAKTLVIQEDRSPPPPAPATLAEVARLYLAQRQALPPEIRARLERRILRADGADPHLPEEERLHRIARGGP